MFEILEEKNRPMLAVIFVLLMMIIGMIMFYTHRPENTISSEFETYLEEAKKPKSVEINVSTERVYIRNNISYVYSINWSSIIFGTDRASIIKYQTENESEYEFRLYTSNKDTFFCAVVNDTFLCYSMKGKLKIPLDQEGSLTILRSIYDKGGIIFDNNRYETKNINGFECTVIRCEIITEKLSDNEKYYILYSAGVPTDNNTTIKLANQLKYANFSLCHNNGTSFESISNVYIEVDGKIEMYSQHNVVTKYKQRNDLTEADVRIPKDAILFNAD